MKTKNWKAIQRELFTRKEVANAERFAKREVVKLKRELSPARKTHERDA